jgi:hypothetical protein
VVCEYKHSANTQAFCCKYKIQYTTEDSTVEICKRKDTVNSIADNIHVCFQVIQFLQINTILTGEQIPKNSFLGMTAKASLISGET